MLVSVAASPVCSKAGPPARKAPAKTHGELTRTTGVVPRMIWKRLSFRMPHMTLVGQSGPPTSTETLENLRPRVLRTRSTPRMKSLSTPTSCWILMDFPRQKPIMYCPQHATSFSAKLRATARETPPQKPIGSAPQRAARTTPAVMYTGTPGTGGKRNMNRPMANNPAMTAPRSQSSSCSFNHDRNTTVAFATPMNRVQYTITR
mmetsp:Transcript_36144/g.100385  ORF Transcript_36144/g.100385 Transcript_36144/m.100385 type:complete len:204 (-) Transcript_36144:372-983(-)